jgi:hypothetical protein
MLRPAGGDGRKYCRTLRPPMRESERSRRSCPAAPRTLLTSADTQSNCARREIRRASVSSCSGPTEGRRAPGMVGRASSTGRQEEERTVNATFSESSSCDGPASARGGRPKRPITTSGSNRDGVTNHRSWTPSNRMEHLEMRVDVRAQTLGGTPQARLDADIPEPRVRPSAKS